MVNTMTNDDLMRIITDSGHINILADEHSYTILLIQRIRQLLADITITSSTEFIKTADLNIVICDDPAAIPSIWRKSKYGIYLTQQDADGDLLSQQPVKDIESQLLAMDKAGIWTLPDDVRIRMKKHSDAPGS